VSVSDATKLLKFGGFCEPSKVSVYRIGLEFLLDLQLVSLVFKDLVYKAKANTLFFLRPRPKPRT